MPCGCCAALRMGQVKPFSLLWESGAFYLAVVFCLPSRGCLSACPAGAKTTFSFACKRKSGSGLRKRKWWTSGNLGVVRYNRMEDRFCWVVPRVKSVGLSFYLWRLAFERPVVPLAPLPLRGWNTVPRPLVSTPPWWVAVGREAGRPLWGDGFLMGEPPLKLCRQRRVNFNGIILVFHQRTHGCGARGTMGA